MLQVKMRLKIMREGSVTQFLDAPVGRTRSTGEFLRQAIDSSCKLMDRVHLVDNPEAQAVVCRQGMVAHEDFFGFGRADSPCQEVRRSHVRGESDCAVAST